MQTPAAPTQSRPRPRRREVTLAGTTGAGVLARLRKRLAREEGFTLIEIAVVLVIIGILLAITISSYLGFRGRASDARAKANVHAVLPAAEAFHGDNGTYTGMTLAALTTSYDRGLDQALAIEVINGGAGFCAHEVGQSGTSWYVKAPGGSLTSTKPAGCP